ncbi:MAG TPA: CBS domain-containing protein [Acidimicrobiales bacterium]|nr:CBS domain-containing protein [Acidimicrobiales bacterium]
MSEESEAGQTPVSTVVTDSIVRVARDASVAEVATVLTEASIGLVVVGEGDDIAGVVSERDIVTTIAEGRDPKTTLAGDIAHTELAWCDLSATVAEVAEEMMERYVRHVLVEDAGRLVGIVSARDLLGVYAAAEDLADM